MMHDAFDAWLVLMQLGDPRCERVPRDAVVLRPRDVQERVPAD